MRGRWREPDLVHDEFLKTLKEFGLKYDDDSLFFFIQTMQRIMKLEKEVVNK